MAQPPGSDTRASRQRASSGPSTRMEARILRTMSYRRLGVGDGAAERQHAALVADAIHGDTVLRQQRGHRFDISKFRHIAQHQAVVGQQSRRINGKRRVLGAADGDLPGKWPSAANYDSIHG